jgi:iron complex transport system substrate-binding protein
MWTLLTALLLALALLAGCGGAAKETQPTTAQPAPQVASDANKAQQPKVTTYPVTVKDASGRDVTIPAEPKRIVSVAPGNTELVFALGKGGTLVGRSDFDDYPAEAQKVPSIGGWMPPNFEKIVAAKPDLVLVIGGSEPDRDKLINDYKLNVFVVQPDTFDQIYAQVTALGVALNAQDAAEKLVADMQKGVKAVADKAATATSKPKVYYEVWDEPLMTAGTGTFVNDVITLAGGVNIAADVKGWPEYSAEKVTAANPDVIIASSADDLAKIKVRKGWESLNALKTSKVVAISDANLLVRPGPRLVQGLQWMAQQLHPELFK